MQRSLFAVMLCAGLALGVPAVAVGGGSMGIKSGKFKVVGDAQGPSQTRGKVTLTGLDCQEGDVVSWELVATNTLMFGDVTNMPGGVPDGLQLLRKGKKLKAKRGGLVGFAVAKATYNLKKQKLTLVFKKGPGMLPPSLPSGQPQPGKPQTTTRDMTVRLHILRSGEPIITCTAVVPWNLKAVATRRGRAIVSGKAAPSQLVE